MGERVMLPVKPAIGQPCNGCGHCCKTEACLLSRDFLHSAVAPCIALEQEDGRYWCGLVRTPSKYLGLPQDWADPQLSCTIAYTLGLGMGCDADDTVSDLFGEG